MNYIKEDIGTTHFLGAGGVGMSALAKLCLKRGKRVSGTDLQAGRRTRELRELGAEIETGPEAQARRDANRVIVSSAIPPDHRELQVYQAMNIPILHRSDLLAEFISDLQSVVVAGTHGKTTTSSLIYHV
ncbi:MAG TPA: UDP-N-acetylmuramate--L-alanine ligase, partial [Phycisphaerales bacterium]|nr:UDP-N-acetylmuramate--L-alanine ligase [Phycisphaerales bacterium]